MTAALSAQERLAVFCIYLLSFLFPFFQRMFCGYMVSLSEMRVCSSVSLRVRPVTVSPGPPPQLLPPGHGTEPEPDRRSACCFAIGGHPPPCSSPSAKVCVVPVSSGSSLGGCSLPSLP